MPRKSHQDLFEKPEDLSDELKESMRAQLDFRDDLLLKECDVHLYRSSGPGGQKKNKTHSAVRLRHRSSGLTTTGTESRSQHENKARALKRLRNEIALRYRIPLPEKIVWPQSVQIVQRRLAVNRKNPAFFDVLALALDALEARNGKIGEAAEVLDVSTSSLTRFLAEHPKAWTEVTRIRKQAGLPPLKA